MLGEANFSDHGANRLGASALMQGLADGYFVIPYTIGDYLASSTLPKVTTDHDAFKEAADNVAERRSTSCSSVKGNRGIREIHRELGRIMWDDVGMARTEASLQRALAAIPKLREEFWHNVSVPGTPDNLNQSLEYAGRVADYLEFAELLALDALDRRESCGGHFREESQTPDGEALRDDEHFIVRGGVGVHRRRQASRSCTRSRSSSTKCIRRRGATSRWLAEAGGRVGQLTDNETQSENLAAGGPRAAGRLVDYAADDVSPDMSFLEMLDVVNEGLIKKGEDAIAFDSDCREGICGMCSLVVNGVPHGPDRGTTVCQLHMRRFKDGDTITIEPWRAKAFPVVKDLVVDRSAFDRIIAAGGYVSVNCGGAPDGNAIPIPKEVSEAAMDSAACIGCGACVAACKNASAHLFMSAKISHLALLPQGQVERDEARRRDDRSGRRRRVRQLLERRRVRSGVPEGDPDLEHRADDARVRQGCVCGTAIAPDSSSDAA